MASLEDLQPGAFVEGLAPGGAAKVVEREWFGDQAAKLTFETPEGEVRNCLVSRNRDLSLIVVRVLRPALASHPAVVALPLRQ